MAFFAWEIKNVSARINPSLRILDDVLRKNGGRARIEQTPLGDRLIIEIDEIGRPTGRPCLPATEDLTIAQISYARFMNVPMTAIAKNMGISVRTLHRRWRKAMESHVHPDTPYSHWP